MLEDYFTKLKDRFTVLYIETSEENEAFIIFETLNARGKSLDTSDLLKNHVFRSASNRLNIIQDKWNQMTDTLEDIDATTFIRHYWNSNNDFARTQSLYKIIRKKINSTKHAEDLVNELSNLAQLYSSIRKPDIKTYYSNLSLNEKLNDLKHLGASSYYPILLALESQQYKEEEVLSILTVLETFIVRNFTTASLNPNVYEKQFSKIAYNISHYNYNGVGDIIEEIRSLIIDDDAFEAAFSTLIVKQDKEKRYLLRKINNHNNDETRIIDNNQIIHIEHILPQKPEKWDIDSEEHELYLNRLGNLTLLGQEYNKSASNDTFETKKKAYKESKIQMSWNLTKYDSWSTSDIEKRQQEFSKTALEIWKK